MNPAQRLTPLRLWNIPVVGSPVVTRSGDRAVVSVSTWDADTNVTTKRIHQVAPTPRVLTRESLVATPRAFSPDGSHLAFTAKSRDDGGAAQLYVMALDGGEAERITDLPLGVTDARWLPDGSGFIITAPVYRNALSLEGTRAEKKRRDEDGAPRVHVTEDRFVRFWDRWLTEGTVDHFFRIDADGEHLIDLAPDTRLWLDWMDPSDSFDIRADGKEVVFEAHHVGGPGDRLRSDVFALGLDETGAVRNLTASHPASSHRPRYLADGTILYGRAHDPDFYADRLRLTHIRGEEHVEVLADWDRSPGGWSVAPDSALYFTADDDARTQLYRYEVGGADPEPLLDSRGSAGAVQPTERGVYYILHSLSAPHDLYLWTADGDSQRVTSFGHDAVADLALGEVRSQTFEGARGDSIQMFVILPPGASGKEPLPLVHLIHGGPHGIFGDQWHARWNAQVIAGAGYAVALVNFHGSTSWGQEFTKCIMGEWGDMPYTDVMAATDALVDQGIADPERMAVTGGSYGGYLTSWITTQTDRFRCAINHAGVFDITLELAGDVPWGWEAEFGGAFWNDPESTDRWNPIRHVQGINTPTLVMHGERDFRVPINNALVCYGILHARGVPTRLVYFEDENHWVLDGENSILWYTEFLSWLKRWL